MKDKNLKQLTEIIDKPLADGISKGFKRSIKTLKYHLSSIKNSFLFPYNDGRIEGITNKIKVLNRVAYGYKNFENYLNQIYLHLAQTNRFFSIENSYQSYLTKSLKYLIADAF